MDYANWVVPPGSDRRPLASLTAEWVTPAECWRVLEELRRIDDPAEHARVLDHFRRAGLDPGADHPAWAKPATAAEPAPGQAGERKGAPPAGTPSGEPGRSRGDRRHRRGRLCRRLGGARRRVRVGPPGGGGHGDRPRGGGAAGVPRPARPGGRGLSRGRSGAARPRPGSATPASSACRSRRTPGWYRPTSLRRAPPRRSRRSGCPRPSPGRSARTGTAGRAIRARGRRSPSRPPRRRRPGRRGSARDRPSPCPIGPGRPATASHPKSAPGPRPAPRARPLRARPRGRRRLRPSAPRAGAAAPAVPPTGRPRHRAPTRRLHRRPRRHRARRSSGRSSRSRPSASPASAAITPGGFEPPAEPTRPASPSRRAWHPLPRRRAAERHRRPPTAASWAAPDSRAPSRSPPTRATPAAPAGRPARTLPNRSHPAHLLARSGRCRTTVPPRPLGSWPAG